MQHPRPEEIKTVESISRKAILQRIAISCKAILQSYFAKLFHNCQENFVGVAAGGGGGGGCWRRGVGVGEGVEAEYV